MTDSLTVDDLDLKLVQALQLDGRAAFSTIAHALGVSSHTIARRYRRLHSSAGLRILGRLGTPPVERPRWMVRLRCAPDAALTIATALARRPDTSFIALVSGGTELICVTESADDEAAESLLLRKLPRTPAIVSITAHRLLRTFYGGPDGWFTKINALTGAQAAALRPPVPSAGRPAEPDDLDKALLAELRKDGRASHVTLQAATRLSEPSVRRRLNRLRTTGTLYFDVQLDPGLLGYRSIALLWLTTSPPALEPVGKALARHPEAAFVAATTGSSNLVAAVVCPNADALYTYLTDRIAALDGIQQVETAPVIHQVKQLEIQ
ncbi:Lrp/AsnC family transcriptional regulator [Actinomadura citrea]|uniref:DNA-binding Lrp family transcriptional regulator n=1 Tax=Actinomadura citrea TaxID=46158 RepID=A0A7Y9G678_9ACTN|nr:AsnC family transcriptional regulator [Actinomadura citrea]NYE10737.1 DNA-binding Lrp family transcriptional regulator [Actinomadura citrea]GGT74318.1 AsnC family transcriptional regulator [Actinomadura citrea]